MELRPATLDDADALLVWRNDEETRRQSFTTDEVAYDDHVAWLRRVIADPDRLLFVGVVDGVVVGQVRLDVDGDAAEISVTVAPDARGNGYARGLIAAAVDVSPVDIVVARIKNGNAASRAAFTAAGFAHRDTTDGIVTMTYGRATPSAIR